MSTQTAFVVPEDIRKKFPDICTLIVNSQSMNDAERSYWVEILPVMNPEQRGNLRGILTNERDQLAAIDAKYRKKETQERYEGVREKITKKREMREFKEVENEEEERLREEEILKSIEEIDAS